MGYYIDLYLVFLKPFLLIQFSVSGSYRQIRSVSAGRMRVLSKLILQFPEVLQTRQQPPHNDFTTGSIFVLYKVIFLLQINYKIDLVNVLYLTTLTLRYHWYL